MPLFVLVIGLTVTPVHAPSLAFVTAGPVVRVVAPPHTSTATAAGESTQVQVVVRPVVSVALDGCGHPIRVIANTTRPPETTDAFTVYGKGHTPAPRYAIQAVMRMAHAVNWSRPGVWRDVKSAPGLGPVPPEASSRHGARPAVGCSRTGPAEPEACPSTLVSDRASAPGPDA